MEHQDADKDKNSTPVANTDGKFNTGCGFGWKFNTSCGYGWKFNTVADTNGKFNTGCGYGQKFNTGCEYGQKFAKTDMISTQVADTNENSTQVADCGLQHKFWSAEPAETELLICGTRGNGTVSLRNPRKRNPRKRNPRKNGIWVIKFMQRWKGNSGIQAFGHGQVIINKQLKYLVIIKEKPNLLTC